MKVIHGLIIVPALLIASQCLNAAQQSEGEVKKSTEFVQSEMKRHAENREYTPVQKGALKNAEAIFEEERDWWNRKVLIRELVEKQSIHPDDIIIDNMAPLDVAVLNEDKPFIQYLKANKAKSKLGACISVKAKLAQHSDVDKTLLRAVCIMRSIPSDVCEMVFDHLKMLRFRNKIIDKKSIKEHCNVKLISDDLLAAKSGRDIKILKVADGSCIQILKGHSSEITCLEVSPDGKLVSGGKDGTIRIWDVESGKCVKLLNCGQTPWCLKFLPNRSLVSGHDNAINIWNLSSGLVTTCDQQCHDLVILGNGNLAVKRVFGIDEYDQNLTRLRNIWDDASFSMNKTKDGHLIVGVHMFKHSCLTIFDNESFKKLKRLKGHEQIVTAIDPGPKGQLISGSEDKTIKIWDLKTGKCLQTLDGAKGSIRELQTTSNGTLIATSQGDGNESAIYFWDMGEGMEEAAFKQEFNKENIDKQSTYFKVPLKAPASGEVSSLSTKKTGDNILLMTHDQALNALPAPIIDRKKQEQE